MMRFDTALFLAMAFLLQGALAGSPAPSEPDFNRDVRPILSRHCFKCHGPDDKARKAKLRLDTRSEALKAGKSGKTPIVPGKPDESELVARILQKDPDEVMPPSTAKLDLSDVQKQILKSWVAAGADYAPHWAFQAPTQGPLPQVKQADWPRNAIDSFVLARLESEGLRPSPAAEPFTLIRRLYLDLIGMPPTPEEADEFVRDPSPAAYEKEVDRLLASPHYGERWARKWLDLARYSDTNGYEKDRQRSIWPWRDWVIKALNDGMPFDRFTIEQLAGDMLPNATQDQIIATGFHRNTMLNEEGGIDPLEFRFVALTDRMATTGKTWLGLTVQCAQCHTHKFDPIPHREYYQMMAFLNNADEPEFEVRPPDYEKRRTEVEQKIAALKADLPNRFRLDERRWETPGAITLTAASGQKPVRLDDGSWIFPEKSAETDTYTATIETDLARIEYVRLEVLPDGKLSRNGPGRSDGGNFVLNEVTLTAAPQDDPGDVQAVKITKAEADFSQDGFGVGAAVDGDPKTGWAIATGGKSDVQRTATFTLAAPLAFERGTRLTLRLEQSFGERHTIGRLRLSVGAQIVDPRPIAERRHEAIEKKFAAWLDRESPTAVRWTMLRPTEAKSNLPLLTVLDDDSVFASGDQTKSDTYRLKFKTQVQGITAIRLEALPDDRLPRHGPGRVYFEGPFGDFALTDFRLFSGEKRLSFSGASHSYAAGGFAATNAIDDNLQTGWAIDGGQGRAHSAVFNLAEPLTDGSDFSLEMLFERHFCADLGRFRISVTTDTRPAIAHNLPQEVEQLLLLPSESRTPAQRARLLDQFLMIAPELAEARAEIDHLRKEISSFPTSLVMTERPPENPRRMFIHNRGEYLQPTDPVEPAVLSILNPQGKLAPRTRLEFAQWLVSPENPLTARVTVNRQWAAFFGRGIVRTVDDFGYQGEPPSHPALLDWLAVEFVRDGWSLKRMHKLIVMSATYQQSSHATQELLTRDPSNVLLARGPRVRLEAELIRDSLLRESGLLTETIGGPSVFPPQPASVTTDGAYGPLTWKVSEGPDRYRRGLYTFSKRTAPYAMFNTFDGPTGDACIAQREISNTPLQALTLLNDTVVVEAAQALGGMFASQSGSLEKRVENLFRRCLVRPPSPDERTLVTSFLNTQEHRFETKELDAATFASKGEGDPNQRAAWTATARALLNLDEAITKD